VKAIVRAVDVGYKNTKLAVSVAEEIQCKVFPSVAPLATDCELSAAFGRKRNTVIVEADGVAYEVGPDARLAEKAMPAHHLDDGFALSPEYLALVRGALHWMQVDAIDLLVVGLPVTTFALRKAELARRLLGEQPTTAGRVVEIREVKVLAQPHGALINYALSDGRIRAMRNQRNLIIDCGARTFDWLVTQGLKIMDPRSHAINRGIYDVLHVLASEIGKHFNIQYDEYERIDLALRTRTPPRVFGKEYDLTPHLPGAKKIAHEAITELRRFVQDGADIDNIILSGGAAFFFREAIRAAFPHHDLQESDDGLYANVRGFARFGVARMAHGDKTRSVVGKIRAAAAV
jgi:plasmid segregation protein ParM